MQQWREMGKKQTCQNHTMFIPKVLMMRAASLSSFSVSVGKAKQEKSTITMPRKTVARVI